MITLRRLVAMAMVAAADKIARYFGRMIAAAWCCPCDDERCTHGEAGR